MSDPRIERVLPMNDHLTRYYLKNGTFVDRQESTLFRYCREAKYEVYLPGGSPTGSALRLSWAKTLRKAIVESYERWPEKEGENG